MIRISKIMRHLISIAKKTLIAKRIKLWSYERYFASSDGYAANRGVYRSFAEASLSAPRAAKIGFDHDALVDEFSDRAGRIFPYDYPALFWLRPALLDAKRVFDIGGHIGVHYYAYERYLRYSPDLIWQICEVPAIVKAGAEQARRRGISNLIFTSSLDDVDGKGELVADGVGIVGHEIAVASSRPVPFELHSAKQRTVRPNCIFIDRRGRKPASVKAMFMQSLREVPTNTVIDRQTAVGSPGILQIERPIGAMILQDHWITHGSAIHLPEKEAGPGKTDRSGVAVGGP